MFISTNVKSVADIYIVDLDLEIYMLIFLLPLILINYIRNLKKLAPFSTVANGVTVVSFGIILYYIIKDNPTTEGKEMVGQLKHFPLFFGTVLFALEAIGVVCFSIMQCMNLLNNALLFSSRLCLWKTK